jgi:alpha,alpha-trehalase
MAPEKETENKVWLANAIRAAVKEYYTVWMAKPRYVADVGLSRYHPEGIGMPPETEASHFDAILAPFAKKYNVDVRTFGQMYADNQVCEPELDQVRAFSLMYSK